MVNLGIIFGGVSPEHEVSIISGLSVIKNLNKRKYNIKQIYIAQDGTWYEHKKFLEPSGIEETKEAVIKNIEKISDVFEYIKNLDIIFPVLHGKNGEDGTIQGLLEILGKKYIGSRVLASSLGMDKAYAKIIFSKANIPQAKSVYIKKFSNNYIYVDGQFEEAVNTLEQTVERVSKTLNFPMFVKPSNSGSSVGINKAHTEEELTQYIQTASDYDRKIVIEEAINGRELECAVFGNEEVYASGVGEILPDDEFYSFDAKYKSEKTKTIAKAEIPEDVVERIRTFAVKAFKAIDGKGLARVDFFWNEENDIVYINEINTMPGFTPISMYSKLWEVAGIKYHDLLENLIQLELQ